VPRRRLRPATHELRWRRNARAAAYDIVLWRNHKRVGDVWTTKSGVAISTLACRSGKRLAHGNYLWFVYPLLDARKRRFGPLMRWGSIEVPRTLRCRARSGG
jgi:hypothetical protein